MSLKISTTRKIHIEECAAQNLTFGRKWVHLVESGYSLLLIFKYVFLRNFFHQVNIFFDI